MRKLGVLGVLAILAAAPVMAHTTADGCVRFDHMAVGDGSVADAAIAPTPFSRKRTSTSEATKATRL